MIQYNVNGIKYNIYFQNNCMGVIKNGKDFIPCIYHTVSLYEFFFKCSINNVWLCIDLDGNIFLDNLESISIVTGYYNKILNVRFKKDEKYGVLINTDNKPEIIVEPIFKNTEALYDYMNSDDYKKKRTLQKFLEV